MFTVEVWRNSVEVAELITARTTMSAGSARMIANHAAKQGHWVCLAHPDGNVERVG